MCQHRGSRLCVCHVYNGSGNLRGGKKGAAFPPDLNHIPHVLLLSPFEMPLWRLYIVRFRCNAVSSTSCCALRWKENKCRSYSAPVPLVSDWDTCDVGRWTACETPRGPPCTGCVTPGSVGLMPTCPAGRESGRTLREWMWPSDRSRATQQARGPGESDTTQSTCRGCTPSRLHTLQRCQRLLNWLAHRASWY